MEPAQERSHGHTLAGITVRYLEMIEAGTKTPTLHVLGKIAKVLGVRTSALIGEAPSEDHEGPVNPRLAELERALITYQTISLKRQRRASQPGRTGRAAQGHAEGGLPRLASTAMPCGYCPG
jgi:transcriptional regulator with XRE-family HTH domain